jgi:hypothetical protein
MTFWAATLTGKANGQEVYSNIEAAGAAIRQFNMDSRVITFDADHAIADRVRVLDGVSMVLQDRAE